MNENFRKLYKESNYSAVGFSQIIGVSRQRFYSIAEGGAKNALLFYLN